MIPTLKPVVLPEDRDAVVAAHQKCHREKNRIYAQHRANAKLAYLKEIPELLEASAEWQEQADLLVSTKFDLVHFDAQIKRAKQLGNDHTWLVKTREEVYRRFKRAKKRFPAAAERAERFYTQAREKQINAASKPFSILEDDTCPQASE